MDSENEQGESEEDVAFVRALAKAMEPLIWEALDHGEQCAHRAYLEWDDKAIDTETFNHMVRNRARVYLSQHGPALDGWALDERLTNNGISVIAVGCQSKLFKAVHGTARNGKPALIPAIVRSKGNRAFVSQMIQPVLFPGLNAYDDALANVVVNLLWIWDHDSHHHIDHLWLVKPISSKKARVIAEWQVEIPNPLKAQFGQIVPMVQEVTDDLDEEIQLPDVREDETGTEE